eukprot:Skav200432  [mRNA]  locus=scaffold578:85572:87562:- [translate_table: standard]
METLASAAMKKLDQLATSLQRVCEFDPQGLANLTWAIATSSVHDPPLMAALSSESIAKMRHFLPQNLGNTAWTLGKLSLQDFQLLHAMAGASISCLSEHKPQEISNTAWALAKLGFKHNPWMDALAQAALENMEDLNPHDLSGIAWAFATLSYTQHGDLLRAISRASLRLLSEFNSQDLANSAWSFATCDLSDLTGDPTEGPVMSSEVMGKLPEFAPQGLATTAWAYSKNKDRTLLEAISREVMQKLYEIEPQSLGILADAKLNCQSYIEQALRPFAQKFADLLPREATTNDMGSVDASMKSFMDFVREVRVDNFGAWGTRHIFQQMCLEEPGPDFISRAKDAILKAGEEAREGVLAGAALVHRRVFAYGEYFLQVPNRSEAISGSMARENGRRDREHRSALIRPLASPISGLVDRGLCSEFQILAKLVDSVVDSIDDPQLLRSVTGHIRLFVSTSPCVSCLWALRQCQLYLPRVNLGVVNGEEVLAPTLRGIG